MFNYLRRKLGITPYRWDWIKLMSSMLLYAALLFKWSSIVLALSFPALCSLVITDLVVYFFIERKHLWTVFFQDNTNAASRKLLKCAEENTLTIDEAKWLLSPGLFRGKADFLGSSSNTNSITVLHWLAHHGKKEVIEFFIKEGVSIKESAFIIGTPFHVAVTRNHPDLLPMLYFREEQLKERVCSLRTPIEYAASEGLLDVFKKLQELKPLVTNEEKLNALNAAIRRDQITILFSYYETDKDILNLKEANGNLIHEAARSGAIKCMTFLLEHANVEHYNLQNDAGQNTPMGLAFFNYSPCYVQLLAKGAKLSPNEESRVTKPAKEALLRAYERVLEDSQFLKPLHSLVQLCGESDRDFAVRTAGTQLRT